MNTATLLALKSYNTPGLTNEDQPGYTGAQSDKILQEWRDWANAAGKPEFSTQSSNTELRLEKALPTLNACLKTPLKRLDLSLLGQENFPACFPSHITSLDLKGNKLTDLTAIMDSLPNTLKFLNVSYNSVVNLHDHYPPYLQVLAIYNNKIETLSEDFVRSLPTSLKELDLSANYLTSLPQNISALPAGFTRLVLMRNHLTDIPEALFTLPASCEIYTLHNPIPAERLQQIEARINAPDYQGPRFFLHTPPDDDYSFPFNLIRSGE